MVVESPDICIVVCTRNRAQQLRNALCSLAALEPSAEFRSCVLVVDNGSEDETENVIREAVAAYPQSDLRSVRESQVGFSHARNRAIQETDCQWIAFFDDDQLAEPDWLIELWNAAQRNNAVCVGGAVRLQFTDSGFEPGPFCRQMLSETDPNAIETRYGPGFEPGTGNLLIKRSVILECGGFATDRDGRGEDAVLFARMRAKNYDAWFTPTAVIHHVISADRNQPDAYRALLRESTRFGDLGWIRWGWRLPFIAIWRLIGCLFLLLPLGWYSLFGTEAQRLDRACAVRFSLSSSLADLRYCIVRLFQRTDEA